MGLLILNEVLNIILGIPHFNNILDHMVIQCKLTDYILSVDFVFMLLLAQIVIGQPSCLPHIIEIMLSLLLVLVIESNSTLAPSKRGGAPLLPRVLLQVSVLSTLLPSFKHYIKQPSIDNKLSGTGSVEHILHKYLGNDSS